MPGALLIIETKLHKSIQASKVHPLCDMHTFGLSCDIFLPGSAICGGGKGTQRGSYQLILRAEEFLCRTKFIATGGGGAPSFVVVL